MIWKKYEIQKPENEEKIVYKILNPVKIGMVQSSVIAMYYGIYNSFLNQLELLDNSPWKNDDGSNIITCLDEGMWCNLEEYLLVMKQIKKEKSTKNKKIKQSKTSNRT